jgi:hypothetical protein
MNDKMPWGIRLLPESEKNAWQKLWEELKEKLAVLQKDPARLHDPDLQNELIRIEAWLQIMEIDSVYQGGGEHINGTYQFSDIMHYALQLIMPEMEAFIQDTSMDSNLRSKLTSGDINAWDVATNIHDKSLWFSLHTGPVPYTDNDGKERNDLLTDSPIAECLFLTPPKVAEFVIDLLADNEIHDLLDPCVGWGSLLGPVLKHYKPRHSLAIHPFHGWPSLYLEADEYRIGWRPHVLKEGEMFDAVVSQIPDLFLAKGYRTLEGYRPWDRLVGRVEDHDLSKLYSMDAREKEEFFSVVSSRPDLYGECGSELREVQPDWERTPENRIEEFWSYFPNRFNTLLESADRLRDSGIGVFVIGSWFPFKREQSDWLLPYDGPEYWEAPLQKALEEKGLFIDACFRVPSGTYRPVHEDEGHIIVVRRGDSSESMFVAEMPSSDQDRQTVLKNYQRKEEGDTYETGILVNRKEFQGMARLDAERKLTNRTKRLNLSRHSFRDMLDQDHPLGGPEESAEERAELIATNRENFAANLILRGKFLKLGVNSSFPFSANKNKNSIDIGPVNCFINPEMADAEFVVNYLNSDLGLQAIRTKLHRGDPEMVALQEFLTLPVWVPPLTEQKMLNSMDRNMDKISSKVTDLKEKFWNQWERIDRTEIDAELKEILGEDSLPSWIKGLPFPLASILWKYHTVKENPKDAYECLDHFFEACTQFVAVILMSGIRDDPKFEREWHDITVKLQEANLSMQAPSLGTWKAIHSNLAKFLRDQLNTNNGKLHWSKMFACESSALLEALTSKKMGNIFEDANISRNKWRGHGGTVGIGEADQRHSTYLDLLERFRTLIGYRWDNWPLVTPVSSRYSGGMYHYEVQDVVGFSTPFMRREVTTSQPMEDRSLYLVNPESHHVCHLIPLVRLGAMPEDISSQGACYFFNKQNSKDRRLRYVSYHYEKQTELVEEFPRARELLKELLFVHPPSEG